MNKQKATLLLVIIIVIVAVVAVGGFILYQYLTTQPKEPTQQAITVTKPIANQTITSPVDVFGDYHANSGTTINIRIKDNNENILSDILTMAGPKYGGMGLGAPIIIMDYVTYLPPSSPQGSMEVFEIDQKNGTEINKVSIPVIFGDYVADQTTENGYTFKSIEQWNFKQENPPYHPNRLLGVYKDGKLVKTIRIANTYTYAEPTLFTLSPDQKYVAFKTAIYGGSCTYWAKPIVINLNNFLIDGLETSNKSDITWQDIKEIRWVSDNTIEVSMSPVDSSCLPNLLPIKLNYSIVK